MNTRQISTKRKETAFRFRALQEAHEAVTTLRTLRPLLSLQDEETLAILIDKELVRHLEQSFKEERQGKVTPLKSILK